MRRMTEGSEMKAMIFICSPHRRQVKGVDLVDTVDELGPSLTQSTSSRENIVLFFLLLFHGVTASDFF